MPNPYNYGSVVIDPEMFFGRERILGDLCTRLEGMQSISVVGLRRVGKSSLLYQLIRILPDRLGQNYIPLYIDLQDARYRTVADFVQTVADKLNRSIGGATDVQAIGTAAQDRVSRRDYLVKLRQVLETSFDEGELRTLCFDLAVEYDSLPGAGKADKARELLHYLERRGRVHELVAVVTPLRPNVSLEYTSEAIRRATSTQSTPLGRLRGLFRAGRSPDKLPVSSVTDMASFSDMLDSLGATNIRPVLCLDEFEGFMRHPEEFNDDFLEALRSLGGRAALAMITTSGRPLIDLVRAGQLTSPFYNIFSHIDLGLLERNASQALRRIPLEREGITFRQEHELLVTELGGRHPFFLQMACHHLYEALSESQNAWADIVRERFNREAEPHFDRLWDHLALRERAALRVAIGRGSPSQEIDTGLKRLARLGVIERGNGEWQPFSQAFAGRIQQFTVPRDRQNVMRWLRERLRSS